MGRIEQDMPEPMSQLYIADSRYAEALRIDSNRHGPFVVKSGKVGIGVNNPDKMLDVKGSANISGEPEVAEGAGFAKTILVNDNLKVFGSLDAAQRSMFGSDVHIRGDLRVEDKTEIEEGLTVTGETSLNASLAVAREINGGELSINGESRLGGPTEIDGTLSVNDKARFNNGVEWSGDLYSDIKQPQAKLHFKTSNNQHALQVDGAEGHGLGPLLQLSQNGHLGLGIASTDAKLDVAGNTNVRGTLTANTIELNDALIASSGHFTHGLKVNGGPTIQTISDDPALGGDSGLGSVLPTQAAVKQYVDNVAVPFGRGGKTFTVSSQRDFDTVFNKGEVTRISEHVTVILLPLNSQNYGVDSYKLKNPVQLKSGVSIIGFNPLTTRICKDNMQARFEIVGSAGSPVSHVHMDGFTYDGNGIECKSNGGAFYLEHANHCTLNCRIENHKTWGDGGGIYGAMESTSGFTVSHIEANHIYHCQAIEEGGSDVQRNEGGAAYGLKASTICAHKCVAEHGGAVAFCDESHVTAYGCHARRGGGAAYRSKLLQLQANDCRADMTRGKGGGAMFCSDLICTGHWTGNCAGEADNIYASDHHTGNHEEHYWKGDYVGRRIDDGESVWRAHNV